MRAPPVLAVSIVTLLTDFGLADTYVGQMKGAILSVAPQATLIDLTHAVAPQDVFGGAFLLWASVDVFPAGTIHVAVVDPGVGSPRRAVAIRSGRGDVFVGPDNGLLIPAVDRRGGRQQAVELTERRYWRAVPSSTFHGRDLFGPVAGHLALGVPLEALGRPVTDLVRLELPEPRGSEGEVIHVDTYGNLVTNFSSEAASEAPGGRIQLRVGKHVAPAAPYYAAVEPGSLIAVVGSTGFWELSARDASAAEVTGATRGTPVTLELD